MPTSDLSTRRRTEAGCEIESFMTFCHLTETTGCSCPNARRRPRRHKSKTWRNHNQSPLANRATSGAGAPRTMISSVHFTTLPQTKTSARTTTPSSIVIVTPSTLAYYNATATTTASSPRYSTTITLWQLKLFNGANAIVSPSINARSKLPCTSLTCKSWHTAWHQHQTVATMTLRL